MEKTEIDKSETRTVSLPLSVWNEVEKRAVENYGGKRSSYIKALVTGDLARGADALGIGDNILVDLVAHYRPAMLEDTVRLIGDANQQMLLDRMVEQIHAFMACPCDHSPANLQILPRDLYADLLAGCRMDQLREIVAKWGPLPDIGMAHGLMRERLDADAPPRTAGGNAEVPAHKTRQAKKRGE